MQAKEMFLYRLQSTSVHPLHVWRFAGRSSGQRRVSGRNAGLPTDADGGFLPESRDRAALPGRDRDSLLRPAPQRPHVALPDEDRPRPQLHHRRRLPASRKHLMLLIHETSESCRSGRLLATGVGQRFPRHSGPASFLLLLTRNNLLLAAAADSGPVS